MGGFTSGPNTSYSEAEEYNGSTWTEVTDQPTAIYYHNGAGTQTAALSFGGEPDDAENFEYDGTNWTDGGDLNTGRGKLFGSGTQTAALAATGLTATANTET